MERGAEDSGTIVCTPHIHYTHSSWSGDFVCAFAFHSGTVALYGKCADDDDLRSGRFHAENLLSPSTGIRKSHSE